ncbi:MAG: hypothetical protein RLZZ468_1642 [Cyanobacteriota bacterium]
MGAPQRCPAVIWLIDLVLLLAGLVLWVRSSNENDEAWSLFLRSVALLDLAFIAFGNGQLLIELPLLALALALPSAASLDNRGS